jgi:DNA-binding beta-propeller fold protein YncE
MLKIGCGTESTAEESTAEEAILPSLGKVCGTNVRHSYRALLLACTFLLPVLIHANIASARPFYRLVSTLRLQSESPAWDYLALDEDHLRLFIARRGDGAAVVDVRNNAFIKTIDRSEYANSIVLVAKLNRGFTINEDGSTTIFDLTTLESIARVKFGDSADSATFDPVSNQVVVAMGDKRSLAFIDPETGALKNTLPMSTDKMEAPTPDGLGNLFTALRNEDAIARIDTRTHSVAALWKTSPCTQPSGLALDLANRRLFIGCRGHGQHPLLAVINLNTGHVVTTLQIGRGNDDVIYDPETGKILTSNGVDGNLVIYSQQEADHYVLSEATTTRPFARTMAMDHRTKKVYLVTAQGTVDPSRERLTAVTLFYPNRYFPNTFEVLTYSAQ